MRKEGDIYVVHRLLDEQICDSEGKRVGRVDDIELLGDPPRVTALLVGDGLYPRRLPRRRAISSFSASRGDRPA